MYTQVIYVTDGVVHSGDGLVDGRRLEGDETSQCEVPVAHRDQTSSGFGLRWGGPALDDPNRSETGAEVPAPVEERVSEFQGDVEALAGLRAATAHSFGVGVELEDDVVDGTAVREAPVGVELDRVLWRVGGARLAGVGEGPAVTEQKRLGEVWLVQAQELAGADTAEAHGLGIGVLAAQAVVSDDGPRDENSVIGGVAKQFMGVGVAPIRVPARSGSVGLEVVLGVDKIEAVGVDELHLARCLVAS